MKRVDLIDIVLCGLLAYLTGFGVYFICGGVLDTSPKFWTTLFIVVLLWGALIRCHPTNPDCPQ
jgi:hypothetical protein